VRALEAALRESGEATSAAQRQRDAAAGIVVAVMLVPQAMAYAQLSGMPPVTGFFAAILALFVVHAAFGLQLGLSI
jgi:SulP family sulfate permease